MIVVAETTTKVVAPVDPKSTAVAPVKLVPVMATDVPPVAGPDVGVIAVIVGSGEVLVAAATVMVVFADAGVVPPAPPTVRVRP